MNFLETITSNYLINVGFVAWFLAQIIKFFLTYLSTKRFVVERLVGAGGMPSSHSSLVCSMTVAMAKLVGFASPLFAIMLCFSAIVMYDAMGVRRAAGEQAKVLNKMVFDFEDLTNEIKALFSGEWDKDDEDERRKQLKEFIGHTPLEVLGGAVLGIIVASSMPV